ncbi:MAG: hypothetical protein Q9225_000202 [Loekoesia sp. 1 TL-2023]
MANTDNLLAWVLPVHAGKLAARIEAYAETKAAIEAFKLSLRHVLPSVSDRVPSLRCLPVEIIDQIESLNRDDAFERIYSGLEYVHRWTLDQGGVRDFYDGMRLGMFARDHCDTREFDRFDDYVMAQEETQEKVAEIERPYVERLRTAKFERARQVSI